MYDVSIYTVQLYIHVPIQVYIYYHLHIFMYIHCKVYLRYRCVWCHAFDARAIIVFREGVLRHALDVLSLPEEQGFPLNWYG